MAYYYAMFIVSMLFVIVYSFIFHKHFDVNLTIMTALVPVINLAFVLMASANDIAEALVALRFTYIGGCFVLVAAMFLIIKTCGVELKPWMRVAIIAVSSLIYSSTLSIGHLDIFYKGIPDLAYSNGAAYITNKEYGFMHTIFYIMIGVYYAVTVVIIIYSFFKKRQVPRQILIMIAIAISVSIFGFFGGRIITNQIEFLPATYNIGVIIYLVIAQRLRLYDPSDSVTDSLVQRGETGFVSFDNKMRYLGSNETAKEMIPELNELIVDHYSKNEWINNTFIPLQKGFENNKENDHVLLERDEKIYLIHVNRLVMGRMNRGFQFLISDDTKNQKFIKLIREYNDELEKEVEAKTEHILEMHDKLVIAMATMVEGRDNSTGGHIKRTSDGVKILIEAMEDSDIPELTPQFKKNVIKAAPMHDLGKIAVSDAILRKPGRYTPEEYEEMKKHPEEGKKIVHQILEGTDDKDFQIVAENVAHYHHERWDGKGYPHGLIGKEIPLEARIMAIADVYDALVSKRVYKDKMSFEEANKIILDGMGTQFDKALEPYYLKARPKLEEYYSHVDC